MMDRAKNRRGIVRTPCSSMAKDTSSGWFDSPLLPFPPQRAKIVRVGDPGFAGLRVVRDFAHHDRWKWLSSN
jgi:hypothetical protein